MKPVDYIKERDTRGKFVLFTINPRGLRGAARQGRVEKFTTWLRRKLESESIWPYSYRHGEVNMVEFWWHESCTKLPDDTVSSIINEALSAFEYVTEVHFQKTTASVM